jgi:hypothetical protein
MMLLPPGVKVHLAFGYTDMRKGIDGLAMLVQGVLRQDPFSGHLFVFRGRRANLIKIVFWDGTGLCLFTKRLEHGVFLWPPNVEPAGTLSLTSVLDGYPGFERLGARGDIRLAACWAHARRKFYEVHQATGSPIAAEALQRIAKLYTIETTIRGQAADARQKARQTRSLPLVEAMKTWLEAQLSHIPPRGALAEAIRYALTRWGYGYLPRRWARRTRHQLRRARHPPHCPRPQEPSLRRIGWWRQALGHRRLADRYRETQRRRAVRLSEGYAGAPVQWSPEQKAR